MRSPLCEIWSAIWAEMQSAMRRLARHPKQVIHTDRAIRVALCVVATVLAFLVLPPHCRAQDAPLPTELQIKAVYLYNFGKFVRWQVNAASGRNSFDICVIGKNPFAGALESTVAGESIDGKSIVIRNIVGMQEASQCRILFISSSEAGRLKPILIAARHLSALTVSDISGFAQRGGMIEFVNQEGRVRFEVNVAPMGESGLTVSSELLKVATRVIGNDHVGEIGR